jgi:hypothetical protein
MRLVPRFVRLPLPANRLRSVLGQASINSVKCIREALRSARQRDRREYPCCHCVLAFWSAALLETRKSYWSGHERGALHTPKHRLTCISAKYAEPKGPMHPLSTET